MVDFIKLDTARLERASTGTSSSTPTDQPDALDVAAFNSVMGNEQNDTNQQHSSDTQDGSQEGLQGGLQDNSQKNVQSGLQGDAQRNLQGGLQDNSQKSVQGGLQDDSQRNLQGGLQDNSQKSVQGGLQGDAQRNLQGGLQDNSQKSVQGGLQGDAQKSVQGGVRDNSQEGLQKSDTTDGNTEAVAQMLLGMTSPLDSLFGNRPSSVDAPTATPEAAAMPAPLTEKLVERILVSQPAQGESEVRLSLNQDTLPGTEIRLNRGSDGLLSVTLITNDASSFQTLVSAQDTLKQRLAAQENGNVQVTVTSGTEQENNDSRRRSRGYQEETYEE